MSTGNQSFLGSLVSSLLPKRIRADESTFLDNVANGALVVAGLTALVTVPLVYNYFDKSIPLLFKHATMGWLTPLIACLLFESMKYLAVYAALSAVSRFGFNPTGNNRMSKGVLVWVLLALAGAFLFGSVSITTSAHAEMRKRTHYAEAIASKPFDETNYPELGRLDSALAVAYRAQNSAQKQTWRGRLTPAGENLLDQAGSRIKELAAYRKETVDRLYAEHVKAQEAAMSVFTGAVDALSVVGGYAEGVYVAALLVSVFARNLYNSHSKSSGASGSGQQPYNGVHVNGRNIARRYRTGAPVNFP